MQTWVKQLDALTIEQRKDLYSYLWDDTTKSYPDDVLKQRILQGKKRHLFKLIDKDAFKTMRRLYRHPERAIDLSIYPVEQLLEVGIAREIVMDDGSLRYELHPQALPLVKTIIHARHFDEYLKDWQMRDHVLMGIMHTYGMIEIHQLCELLKGFNIVVDAQEMLQSVRWRLSIRNLLQVHETKKGKQSTAYIVLKQCDIEKLSKLRKQNCDCSKKAPTYEEVLYRKNRYYALNNNEVQNFMKELKVRFSHQFAEMSAKEMMDVYQYHHGAFTHYDLMIRVLDKEKIDILKDQAIASFDTLY